MINSAILEELRNLPSSWRFTPVNGSKAPYLSGWQKIPLTFQEFIDKYASDRRTHAVGLLTGVVSNGILAVDHDGHSGDLLIKELSRHTLAKALPKTVGFSSGKPGRYQLLYQVPQLFWGYINNKAILTGAKDTEGKDEQIDFRWNEKQSVILGKHPETGAYRWLEGCSPSQVQVGECPKWIIRQILSFRQALPKASKKEWSDREWALEYLGWIPNQDLEWHQWRNILLALHHSGVEEEIAQIWSASSDKHTDKGFEDVWRHIKDNKPEGENLTVAYLGQLAKENGRRTRSVSGNFNKTSQLNFDDESDEDLRVDTERLLIEASQDFDIYRLLHPKLAKPLIEISEVFNQPATVAAACLIAIAASLLKVGTSIRITARSDYEQPPIIWVCLPGDSDAGKSPIIGILKKPLNSLQLQSYHNYQQRKADYELELTQWEAEAKKERGAKPTLTPMRQFIFNDFTTEAIADSLKHHPEHGALVCVDELASLLYGFNQYKKRGNDRQQWLTFYDGGDLNIVRKTQEFIYLSKTNLSILGGIQPCVLREVMGDLNYVDGFWTRFFYVSLRHSIMPAIDWDNDRDTGLNEILKKAYQALDELSAKTYQLSDECRPIWNEWHEWTERERFNENHLALRAVYRKARAKAARIASIIHCLNAVVDNSIPAQKISTATLKAAIAFTRYGIDQIRSIYADFGVVDTLQAVRIARFVERFWGCGWVSARQVIHWYPTKEKPNAEQARKFMKTVVSLEYARDNGQQDKHYRIQIIDSGNNSSNKQSQNYSDQELEMLLPVSNKLCNDSNQSEEIPELANAKSGNVTTDEENVTKNVTTFVTRQEPLQKKDSDGFVSAVTTDLEIENSKNYSRKNNDRSHSPEKITEIACMVADSNLVTSQNDPRNAVTIDGDRVVVDEDKLDLNYQPEIPIPSWQPTKKLKSYESLSKLYLDIETTGLDCDRDRILLVGLRNERGQVTIFDDTDEKILLTKTWQFIRDNKPELLVGHNLFNFDLPFLIGRFKHYCIKHYFRKGNESKKISASSFNGKPIEFTPIRLSGTNIIDTFQQVCIWDKSAAKLTSYGLKPSVKALGLRTDERLELTAQQIQEYATDNNLEPVKTYLEADLEDTQLLADFLLPVVYYQRSIVPDLSFQDLAVASPALKAQKIHESLSNGEKTKADRPLKYEGAAIACYQSGLHQNVAKIDISSLYPSIMLRYGICSHKDTEHRFLGVMQYMREERLQLKALAKSEDIQANHQQNALKILINGSYGFLGTGGYSFNDYAASALITAYGRKILRLMESIVIEHEAVLIESDTDGILFSHPQPEIVCEAISKALPDGIQAELEFSGCGLFIPKAKTYVIVYPDGETTVKGLFRKRDRYPLQNEFPIEFVKRYFIQNPDAANRYYQKIRESLLKRSILIEQLTIRRKIGTGEKRLVERGLGQPGEIVSYYYMEQKRLHSKNGKPLSSTAVETNSGDYWIDYYLRELDSQYQEITGDVIVQENTRQLGLWESDRNE
jgi:DNA polymerase elongation subunit (family B)